MESRINVQIDIEHEFNLPTAKGVVDLIVDALWEALRANQPGFDDANFEVAGKLISAVVQRRDVITTIREEGEE